MSSVTKALLGLVLGGLLGMARSEPLYILALGDELASGCPVSPAEASPGVFVLGPDGVEHAAVGAECPPGAAWAPLGRRLIAEKRADKVVFLPVGAAAHAPMGDWLSGAAQGRLAAAMKLARERHLRFAYVLWQQGASDRGGDAQRYRQGLGKVLKQVRLGVNADKILVARHTGCEGAFDTKLWHAQNAFSENAHFRIFPGPDVDALVQAHPAGGCHLDAAGQAALAVAWADALGAAEKASMAIRKETLLFYF